MSERAFLKVYQVVVSLSNNILHRGHIRVYIKALLPLCLKFAKIILSYVYYYFLKFMNF